MKKLFIFVLIIILFSFAFIIGLKTGKAPVKDNETVTSPAGEIEEEKSTITKQEAEELCIDVLGEIAEETGFPISYNCIGEYSSNGKLYYVMHISWLVNNTHRSYIGNCFVSSDGKEIYDGIALGEEYTITELRWKK